MCSYSLRYFCVWYFQQKESVLPSVDTYQLTIFIGLQTTLISYNRNINKNYPRGLCLCCENLSMERVN
jgi:hypothetical protein